LLAAPTLGPLADVTVLAGAPLHVALDGEAGGEAIQYEVASSNPALAVEVIQGNPSLKMSVDGFGDMVFQLFGDLAPGTTERISRLAAEGFYDGLTFHRVASFGDGRPFVIQGGDPRGDGTGGSGVEFDDEFHPLLMHTSSGVLSMAKSLDDTNDSQFFITAGPTRFLDFNHSIFGFLVEGDDVREAIQSVPVGAGDRPIEDVVISSITRFDDAENAVLRLSAPEGTAGEADVTVTARSAGGEQTRQTFHVSIAPDGEDSFPFLGAIDPIQTSAGQPVSFDIPAIDVEGDAVYYGGWNLARWPAPGQDWRSARQPDLEIAVHPTTGRATIRPANGVVGVRGVLVGVNAFSEVDEEQTDPRGLSGFWDLQFVPVFIAPPSPSLALAAASDTGREGDGITSVRRLEEEGQSLRLVVRGVIQGAEVTLQLDGVELPQTELGRAQDDDGTWRVTIRLDDPRRLAEGRHELTAVQTLREQPVEVGNRSGTVDLVSEPSEPLALVIDNTPPDITSEPSPIALPGRPYRYDVQTAEEAEGTVTYRLVRSPAGMVIDPASGVVTWVAGVGDADPSVAVRATDLAGNAVDQVFDIEVAEGPDMESVPPQSVWEGELVEFTVEASGGVGKLTFSLDPAAPDGTPLPDGASIDPDTGHFTWQTGERDGSRQAYPITVRVTDSIGATTFRVVLVRVWETNQPPVLESIGGRPVGETPPQFTAYAGRRLALDVVARDADLPPDPLTFELVGETPPGATIDPRTGRFSWTPTAEQAEGDYDLLVRVWDQGFQPDEAWFRVSVRPIDPGLVGTEGERLAQQRAAVEPVGRPQRPVSLDLATGQALPLLERPPTPLFAPPTGGSHQPSAATRIRVGVESSRSSLASVNAEYEQQTEQPGRRQQEKEEEQRQPTPQRDQRTVRTQPSWAAGRPVQDARANIASDQQPRCRPVPARSGLPQAERAEQLAAIDAAIQSLGETGHSENDQTATPGDPTGACSPARERPAKAQATLLAPEQPAG